MAARHGAAQPARSRWFWQKLAALPPYKGRVPRQRTPGYREDDAGAEARQKPKYKIAHRIAGMGSLGRQRFVALAEYDGGPICREAKALATSAWDWAHGDDSQPIRYQKALDIAVRAHDPFVRLQGRWIVRRLAPDCSKIELAISRKRRTKPNCSTPWDGRPRTCTSDRRARKRCSPT